MPVLQLNCNRVISHCHCNTPPPPPYFPNQGESTSSELLLTMQSLSLPHMALVAFPPLGCTGECGARPAHTLRPRKPPLPPEPARRRAALARPSRPLGAATPPLRARQPLSATERVPGGSSPRMASPVAPTAQPHRPGLCGVRAGRRAGS